MIGSRFFPCPLLAAALLVAACAGEPATPAQPAETPTQDQSLGCEDCSDEFVKYYWRVVGPGDRILFDYDSAALRPDAVETSRLMVRWLDEFHPGAILMIEGHTDDRGPNDYNLELGCRRALAMRDALIEHGFALERLGTISYGEERPAVLRGANEAGWEAAWAQNRRAVRVVVDELWRSNCGER